MEGRRFHIRRTSMKRILSARWLQLVARFGIGAVFLYAGFTKLHDPLSFTDSIATFSVLPVQLINVVAFTLPPLEILFGGLLVAGVWMRPVLFGLGLLTAVFIAALLQGLIRGLAVDCGCFGSGEPSVWRTWGTLARDGVLFCVISFWYFKCLPVSEMRSHCDKNVT